MRELYRNAADDPASTFAFDNEALAASLERIYRQKFNPGTEIDRGLFDAILETLNEGTERGFNPAASSRYQDFLGALKSNNAVFAAFKTHRMQNDIARQLLDGNGELKPFSQFKKDVAGITSHQVGRWLKTEYDTAVIRAHQAADWQQFMREKDILPNLRWNESTSLEPRPSHKKFWGRIWPIDHPHWAKHRPGDEWGCKCSLSSTAEPPTDNSDLGTALAPAAPGLGGNPGVTAKIFSDDHPYVANAYKGAKKAVTDLLRDLQIAKETLDIKKFKSGGVLQTPKEFHQNVAEERKNVRGYTELAKMHGERYKLLNVVNEANHKNPDAYNIRTGLYSDMKTPTGKNGIQAAIKEASDQRVGEVYIYLTKEYSRKDIYNSLRAAFQRGRAATIQDVIIRMHNGDLRRYEVAKIRKWRKLTPGDKR